MRSAANRLGRSAKRASAPRRLAQDCGRPEWPCVSPPCRGLRAEASAKGRRAKPSRRGLRSIRSWSEFAEGKRVPRGRGRAETCATRRGGSAARIAKGAGDRPRSSKLGCVSLPARDERRPAVRVWGMRVKSWTRRGSAASRTSSEYDSPSRQGDGVLATERPTARTSVPGSPSGDAEPFRQGVPLR